MARSPREWADHDASMADAKHQLQEWDPEYQNYHGDQPLQWGTNSYLPGNSKYRNVPAELAYNDPKQEALVEKQIASNIAGLYVSHPKMSEQIRSIAGKPSSEQKLGFAVSQIIIGTRDKMMGKKLLSNDQIWAAQDGVAANVIDKIMAMTFGDKVDMDYRERVANESIKFLEMYDQAGQKAKDQGPTDKTQGRNTAVGDQSAAGLLGAAAGGFGAGTSGGGGGTPTRHMYSEVVPENTARAKAEARELARRREQESSGGALGNLFGSMGG